MYNEILKLKQMLDEAKIPYESFEPQSDGYQLRLNENIDVIEHHASYGGECDKLEIMGALTKREHESNSVIGWLTAEEVFARFKYCYENNTTVYDDGKEYLYILEKVVQGIATAITYLDKDLRKKKYPCYGKFQDEIDKLAIIKQNLQSYIDKENK